MARIKERLAKDGTKRFTTEVRLKGYPTQTATFKRITDAKKWIQDTESAIREGRHFKTAEAKKHTFADLVKRYTKDEIPKYNQREQKERKAKLDWWAERMGVYALSDITPALIVEHRNTLAETRSPATVVRYLAALSHSFTIAIKEWGWLEDSPTRKVNKPPENNSRVRFLDDEERKKLLDQCKQSKNTLLYLNVILAVSTGMRQGEQMALKWRDVNLKDGYLVLNKTKNGERRRVPLSGHCLELLKEHAKVKRLDTELLFPSDSQPSKPANLRCAFLYALERAEIENFHWHDLRHTTASYLIMNGASLAEVGEILGHKTLSMVKRYSHLSDGHVSNVVASMNAKIFGGI